MCTPSLAMSPLAKLAATPLLVYLGTYPKHGTRTLHRNNWVKKMPAGHNEHMLGRAVDPRSPERLLIHATLSKKAYRCEITPLMIIASVINQKFYLYIMILGRTRSK